MTLSLPKTKYLHMITVFKIKFIFFYAQEKTTQSILPVFSVKSIQEILDVEKQKVVEDCVKITQVKTKIGQIKTKIGQIKTKIVQVNIKIV